MFKLLNKRNRSLRAYPDPSGSIVYVNYVWTLKICNEMIVFSEFFQPLENQERSDRQRRAEGEQLSFYFMSTISA